MEVEDQFVDNEPTNEIDNLRQLPLDDLYPNCCGCLARIGCRKKRETAFYENKYEDELDSYLKDKGVQFPYKDEGDEQL